VEISEKLRGIWSNPTKEISIIIKGGLNPLFLEEASFWQEFLSITGYFFHQNV
jgi:hypothetical protein